MPCAGQTLSRILLSHIFGRYACGVSCPLAVLGRFWVHAVRSINKINEQKKHSCDILFLLSPTKQPIIYACIYFGVLWTAFQIRHDHKCDEYENNFSRRENIRQPVSFSHVLSVLWISLCCWFLLLLHSKKKKRAEWSFHYIWRWFACVALTPM